MKKFKSSFYPLILILITAIGSCKMDTFFLPIHRSSRLNVIAKLADDKKVSQQEMTNWYIVNIQSSIIKPQWNKALQTIYNGNHTVEVPIGDDGALFFIKEKNMLSVFAGRWQDNGTWIDQFTGNIVYYSFRTNKMTASVYGDSGLVRTGNFDIPELHRQEVIGPFFLVFMSPSFWSLVKVKH